MAARAAARLSLPPCLWLKTSRVTAGLRWCIRSVSVARSLVLIVYAILLGGLSLYGQFDWDPPLGRGFWFGSGPGTELVIAGAIVVGFVVGRWYATVAALAPVFAAVPMQLQGRVGDFHDAYPPLEQPFLAVGVIGAALLLALGVALGKGFQRLVAARDSAPTPAS
ncbi:MAG TPA: hypothetical protein VNA28_18260 [Solirubrobacteraceae bacterium]|nr:hypothetical protein [Solirubrobacteraceae bacterium]